MKTFAALAVSLALAAPVAAATADKSAPPLDDVLRAAAGKPVLLDFGAVWCGPCKMLDAELHKPELADALTPFAMQRYDAERGEGAKAAERYHVRSFPTLIVVDGGGNELARRGGFDPEIGAWLRRWGALASTDAAAEKQLGKTPDDLALLWGMATRAEARKDAAARRRWLQRIEAADKSPGRRDAAEAAWQRLTLDARDKVYATVRPMLADYARGYPARAATALQLAAAAGTDKAALDAAFHRAAEAASGEALNDLAYAALSTRAYDAALFAAKKQLEAAPDDANLMDTLAEVYHCRGESDRAVELERQAVKKDPHNKQLVDNLERFSRRSGEPSLAMMFPPSLGDELFQEGEGSGLMPPSTPADIGRRQFAHESARVAKACGSSWPKGLDEAYVRITLGASAHAEGVELLEPRASAAFKRCVADAVRAIDVPADSPAAQFVVGFKRAAPSPMMPK